MDNNTINFFKQQYAITANLFAIRSTDDMVQLNSAINLLNQAIRNYPEQTVLYFNRGYFFYKIKNYIDALKDAEKAISLSNECIDAYKLKCICLSELGKIKDCRGEIKKSIDISKKLNDFDSQIYFQRLEKLVLNE